MSAGGHGSVGAFPSESPGAALRLSSAPGRWLLGATVLGSGMGFLDATVINVALPAIGRDLGADVSELQWTVNGYLLTLAALIMLGGSLGDRLGRRRVFVAGVVWFAAASLLCALAWSPEALIAARLLQGAGGALLTPGSLALIEASFVPVDRGRAIGAWSALSGVAAAIGPLLGGWLVDAASWRWVFLINLPLAAVIVAAAVRHVPESRDVQAAGPLDVRGSALAVLALGGITFALIEAPRQGIAAPAVLVAAATGLGGLVALVVAERHAREPMLPPVIFSSGQFVVANLVTFAVYAGLGGVLFLLVIYLQTGLGYSATEAGAATLPITALMLLLSPRMGALAQAIGPRVPLTAGPLLLAAGMLLLLRVEPDSSYGGAVLPALAVFGLGLATTVAPVTATALAASDPRHVGVASAVNNAVSRAAQLLAVAVLPVVAGLSGADVLDPATFTRGFHTAMVVTAALAALGGLLALATVRADVLEEGPPEHPAAIRHCAVAGTPLDGREAAAARDVALRP